MLGFGFTFRLSFIAQYSLNPSKSWPATQTGSALFIYGCSKCWKADYEYWRIFKSHQQNSWRNLPDVLENFHLLAEKTPLKQWFGKHCNPVTPTSIFFFFSAFSVNFHLLHFTIWLTALSKSSFNSISEFSGNISIFMQDSQGFFLKYFLILRWNYIQDINSVKMYPGTRKQNWKQDLT